MNPKLWHLINVRTIAALCLCLALLLPRPARAQDDAVFKKPAHHTQVTLLLSADTAKPGDTIWAGVDLKMESGWHTYWKNPGDAGSATEIKWQLPAGITAGEIQWPLPEKLPPIEVTTYGYENEVMLIVPLRVTTSLSGSEIDLKANVSWLECKDVCIPANQDVEAKLNIGSETKNSTDATAIESWNSKVPGPVRGIPYSYHAWWEKPASGDTRPLIIEMHQEGNIAASVPLDGADFYPDASDSFEVQPATDILAAATSEVKLRLLVKKYSGDWPKEISGVLVTELRNHQQQGNTVKFPIADKPPAGEIMSATTGQPTQPSKPLWLILIYAFIGGLILNIMPCVLPVIALKILGFVSEARSEPGRVRILGGIYAIGVLFSFFTFAAIVIGLKAAGHQVGWGMQFGSPVFVVCLTTLVTLVALNLFGVFEVTPGGSTFDKANELASKHGAAGAFFNGVLATTLATPCTAAFLVDAIGYAFTQSPPVILAIFLTVGLGLASPYVVLSWNPAWLKYLPKPGAWMEKFKIAMGFPMLATVLWLFNTAIADYGEKVFWLGAFLVTVAAAAWVFGEFFQRGRNHKGLALAVVLILLAGGYAFALENKLHWREMLAESPTTKLSNDKVNWQLWSPEAVATARATGKIVLVDFTATWCVTCNAVVKPALESDLVAAELKKSNVVTLLADNTRTPKDIGDEIAKYGGAGVPLVLVYPKNADLPAIVLPQPGPLQLSSGYAKIILDALGKAAN